MSVQLTAGSWSVNWTRYLNPGSECQKSTTVFPVTRIEWNVGPASTFTVKMTEPVNGGNPLSITCKVIRFVPTCSTPGVQINWPLKGSIEAPVGGDGRLNRSWLVGMSESDATNRLVIVKPGY